MTTDHLNKQALSAVAFPAGERRSTWTKWTRVPALLLASSLLLLVGCGTLELSVENSPVPTVVGTPSPPPVASVQAPTSTPLPTLESEPTASLQTPTPRADPTSASTPSTPAPTPTPTTAAPEVTTLAQPEPERVRFAAGAASATVEGVLTAAGVDRYVLSALAGQTLYVDILAAHPVRLSVRAADGSVLKESGDGTTHWEAPLAASQDYLLVLAASGAQTDYQMTVTIPPLPQPTPAIATYRDAEGSFSVSYPADFAVDAACPTQGIVADPLVTFRLSEDAYYAGTNLRDACVSIAVERGEAETSTCTGLRGPNEAHGGQEEINGVLFSIVSRGGVAAGHNHELLSYRTLHAGACYDVTLLLHYVNPGVYAPGTVVEFEHDVVLDRLRQVLQGFRFTDGGT